MDNLVVLVPIAGAIALAGRLVGSSGSLKEDARFLFSFVDPPFHGAKHSKLWRVSHQ